MRQRQGRYCTGPDCLCTRVFLVYTDTLVCSYCRKVYTFTTKETPRNPD